MTVRALYPAELPSLNLDFANSKSLDPRITFTRATTGTFVGADGFIKTAGVDAPRFQHDPVTGRCLGLLVEEARTNGIRNNTMVGASAPSTLPTNWTALSSVAGISFEVVGVGTESGISYIDIRIYGTPSANGTALIATEQNTTNAAASGETWTLSSYCRLMAGTLPPSLYLRARLADSGGSALPSSDTLINPTGSPLISQRFTHVAALTDPSTAFITERIDATLQSGIPVDFTLRIGMPQLEKGAFATSVIPTTSSAVTRAADIATISGSNFSSWYRQDEGSLFIEAGPYPGVTGINYAIVSANAGSYNDGVHIFAGSGPSAVFAVREANVDQCYISAGLFLDPARASKISAAYALNNFARSLYGSPAATDNSGTVPTFLNQFRIGSIPSISAISAINGPISRLTYWPRRLPDSTLQELTR